MRHEGTWSRLVAVREVRTRLRDRTFQVSTALLVVLTLGGIVAGSLLGDRASAYEVVVTTPDGAAVASAAQDGLRAAGDEGGHVTVARVDDADAARDAVSAGDADAALLPRPDGFALVARGSVPADLSTATRGALARTALERNASEAGTTVEALTDGATLHPRTLDAGPLSPETTQAVGFYLALLFFVTAVTFGLAIAQSVVVEKENRVVEILAAAVPLRALLRGKVAGNSLLALGQVLVVAAAAVVGLLATRPDTLDVLTATGSAGLWFLAFFVVGFLALASLWSVAGSLATRQDDLQSTALPGQMIVAVPLLVAASGHPQALAVASYVPVASSMTMPGRLLTEDLPVWQPALSLLLAAAAAALLVRLGARGYERTLLQTSRRTSYRELLDHTLTPSR